MNASLLLSVLLLGLSAPAGLAQQGTNDDFAIYVAEPSVWRPTGDLSQLRLMGPPVISLADIVSYDWATHTMTVTTNAILRLPRFHTETFTNFVIVVRGERCYAGSFWPLDVSARPMPRDTPIIPVPTNPSRARTNPVVSIGINIRLGPQGFVSKPPARQDVRADRRVYDMLSRHGKLKPISTEGTPTRVSKAGDTPLLPADQTLNALRNLPSKATLDDVLAITGKPGADVGSGIHEFIFQLSDRSFLQVRARYDKTLLSIKHGDLELLHKQ